VVEPAGGRWRPTSMRHLSLTVPVRTRPVVAAATIVAVATACGTGLSVGHASAAGQGHPAASGQPAAVSRGIAEAQHRGAAPPRWILPCRPDGRARRVAARACRVSSRGPLPSPALWRIMCPMAVAGPGHPARVIVSRPGCWLFCRTKAGALARCGPIWGCWNAGQQAGRNLICAAEGTGSPHNVTPDGVAAAGRSAAVGGGRSRRWWPGSR
jgi:hypothetical protein